MDLDKLFEGIHAIQKQLGEFQQEMREEISEIKGDITEMKRDIKNIDERLSGIEASVEILANRQFKHETEIEIMKKRFFTTV
ncbi:hypothetical protein [Tepidibacillus marianensis]|uniref:hypothetical protein n=1 Tax=Tepidibacillus marianensis TaxID=3131995 RepID=UPI0030D2F585